MNAQRIIVLIPKGGKRLTETIMVIYKKCPKRYTFSDKDKNWENCIFFLTGKMKNV